MHYVYVMASARHSKVGVSKAPARRTRNLQRDLSLPLSLVAAFAFPTRKLAQFVERRCHDALARHRILGTEWFSSSPEERRKIVAEFHEQHETAPSVEASNAGSVLRDTLVDLRKSTGLNQVEFAEQLHWNRGMVERIEAGHQIPTFLEAIDWARACGVTAIGFSYRFQARIKRSL